MTSGQNRRGLRKASNLWTNSLDFGDKEGKGGKKYQSLVDGIYESSLRRKRFLMLLRLDRQTLRGDDVPAAIQICQKC